MCMFGQCPCLCIIYHTSQHTSIVHMSLQVDGKFTFKDTLVFGICLPACHDSLVVLVLFLDDVILSNVHARNLDHFLSAHCSRVVECCLRPSPLSLISYNQFADFQRTVLVASVVVIVVFMRIMICHQQMQHVMVYINILLIFICLSTYIMLLIMTFEQL